MRVAEFEADHAEWPHQPPKFGSRWQLAKNFVSKFTIINPGPGEHLKTRSMKAYGHTFFESNQRLREIGTHPLGSVAFLAIMKRPEDLSGPVMSAAMNKFRNRDVLSALAYVYELDQYILTGTTSAGKPRQLDRDMLADCLLALVAAIYQDNGWEIMRGWLEDSILPVVVASPNPSTSAPPTAEISTEAPKTNPECQGREIKLQFWMLGWSYTSQAKRPSSSPGVGELDDGGGGVKEEENKEGKQDEDENDDVEVQLTSRSPFTRETGTRRRRSWKRVRFGMGDRLTRVEEMAKQDRRKKKKEMKQGRGSESPESP
ncbi:hypothetical protein TWF506_004830 [Arthrobotrys conoides]|uniref:RNase III domain-containing protein n=1 Tax=Arthrobotrys conoides TaxID=74498 RepID=A0AAN8RVL3_9PEZI